MNGYLNGMIGNKSNFLSVEAAEKRRRSDFVESPCLTDGENQLCEHFADVGNTGFCFCPKVIGSKRIYPLVNLLDSNIYVFDNCSAIEVAEEVSCDSVFEFLLL